MAGRCGGRRSGSRSRIRQRRGGRAATASAGRRGWLTGLRGPHASPSRTPARTERRIVRLRVSERLGPARIAFRLGLAPSTVHAVLDRYGCPPLAHLDRASGQRVRRYQRTAPGELVHVDIKKLGNIPDGGGWRVHGHRGSPTF